MYERIRSVGWEPHTSKLRTDQIANRSNWTGVPNGRAAEAAMHTIRMVPKNGSTETIINPIDPDGDQYLDVPGAKGSVARSGVWQGY
jgi:hypothetical protein